MITNCIQLDFNKENDLKVPSVQYDSGSRFVKIKLQRNKSPFEIDGYRVTVVANKVDGTEIMNDCTILDGVNGVVQFEITEQFNAVEGVVDCQLKLFKGKTLLTSMPFSINVVKSVSTKEIVSSNELKTLVNALGEVQNIDNRFAQTNAQLSQEITELNVIKANKGDIGTPLVANSIHEMKDTTKIYVNTTDGKWYSYNGTAWIAGGVYNSLAVGNGTLDIATTKGTMSTSNLYVYSRDFIGGWYIKPNGELNTSAEAGYAKIPIRGGEKICIYKPDNRYGTSVGVGLFLDSSGGTLSTIVLENYKFGKYNDKDTVVITSPENAYFLCLNVKLNSFDDSLTTIVEYGTKIENKNALSKLYGYNLRDVEFDTFKNSIGYSSLNEYNYNNHYYDGVFVNNAGDVRTMNGWGLARIPCDENTVYSLQLPSNIYGGAIGRLAYYRDEEKLSYVLASNLISGTANGANFITFTTPTGCNNIRITCKRTDEVDSFDNSRTLIVTKGSTILQAYKYDTYIDSLFGYQLKDNTIENKGTIAESPLKGLKWVALGDSLTEKNIRTTKNYHDYIADETGVVVVNMGVGGSGYKKREGENKAFYQRVLNTPLDADIVTIFGSGNDLSLTLGTPTDSGTDTLCGCINTTIDNLYSILPTVKLGIITPTPWGKYPTHEVNNKMDLYSNAIVEICKRRGIPCLDLYHSSNMRPWDDTFKNLMYKRDDGNSVHPDEDGHKFMYRRFLTFIESL